MTSHKTELPPGSISLSEWHDLKKRYHAWGSKPYRPSYPRFGHRLGCRKIRVEPTNKPAKKARKHRLIEKYYNPDWPPYQTEREIPERITYITHKYHEYVKDKRILLYEQRDPTSHIAKPYVVRGTDQYDKRTKKRLSDIRSDWDSRPGKDKGMFITISPRAVGSVWAIHNKIKKLWPKLTDWMRHRFLYDRSIWATEPLQRHYTHYHMVISGYHSGGLMAQEIKHWLQDHDVDIEDAGVDVKPCRSDPMGYAMKYVSKGTTDLFWQGMMWMTNGRMWGASRGLGRGGVVTKSERKWTYCGVCNHEWFAKWRGSLVWGDVLPQLLADDLTKLISDRDNYYRDVY